MQSLTTEKMMPTEESATGARISEEETLWLQTQETEDFNGPVFLNQGNHGDRS